MNNKNILSATLYAVLSVSLFILIQDLSFKGGKQPVSLLGGIEATDRGCLTKDGKTLVITAIIGSLATLTLSIVTKWAPVSGSYLKVRPQAVLTWSVPITLSPILPLQFPAEKINLTMPAGIEKVFESIMKVSWGYVALGMVVPIVERIVFRDTILRVLQNALGERKRWIAAVISALIFGIAHLNLAQGLHAFLIGLLLGWLCSRAGSILSGFIFHRMDNTVAYPVFDLMPQMNDGKLTDFFHGDDRMMYGGLFLSLCTFVPSLLQLIGRMPKGNK